MADRTRLRQLFLNLVTNAIKYTPAGGKVELGLGRHPDNVTFAVRDTGIGISAADFPHIFERFWRADRVRSRMSERGGFGLGLAISQWIAQAHGGTLTASSRLGRGSLFTVTLPIATEAERSYPFPNANVSSLSHSANATAIPHRVRLREVVFDNCPETKCSTGFWSRRRITRVPSAERPPA